MKTVGSIVRVARERINKTQTWLGLEVGTSVSTISRIETNKLVPDRDLINHISDVLKLPSEDRDELILLNSRAREAKVNAKLHVGIEVSRTRFPIEFLERRLDDFLNIRLKGELGFVTVVDNCIRELLELRNSYPNDKQLLNILLSKFVILRLDIYIPTLPPRYLESKTSFDLRLLEDTQNALRHEYPDDYDLAQVLPGSVQHIMGDSESALENRRKHVDIVNASLAKAICIQDLVEESMLAFLDGKMSHSEASDKFSRDLEDAFNMIEKYRFRSIERAIILESASRASRSLGFSNDQELINRAWHELNKSVNSAHMSPEAYFMRNDAELPQFAQPLHTTQAMIHRTELLNHLQSSDYEPQVLLDEVEKVMPFFKHTKHLRYWLQVLDGMRKHDNPLIVEAGDYHYHSLGNVVAWLP